MKTLNKLLELLDNFVDNMEYGFTHLSEATNNPIFLSNLSTLLSIMAALIAILFTCSAIFGHGGLGMNKALLYVGFALSIFLLAIAIGIRVFLI